MSSTNEGAGVEGADGLAELRALSAEIGAEPLLVQGAGGNVSLKRDGVLHVKASGTWLVDAFRAPIFVALDLARARAIAEAGGESFTGALSGAGDALRPSIETPFHALLPQRVVVHVHSINAIAWSVIPGPGARDELGRRLGGVDWVWIDYARPGQPLTRALIEGIAGRNPAPELIVLRNHGIVVCGDDCRQARARLRDVERRLRRETLPAPGSFDLARLEAARARAGDGYELPADLRLHALGRDATMLRHARRGALVPDHVVFLGAHAHVLDEDTPRPEARPPYWLVPGGGVLVSRTISRGAYAMLQAWTNVVSRVEPATDVIALLPDDVSALAEMEAETYRQAMERGSAR